MRPRTAKTSTADFYCQSLHSFNLSYRYKLLEEYLGQCRSTILADKFVHFVSYFRLDYYHKKYLITSNYILYLVVV